MGIYVWKSALIFPADRDISHTELQAVIFTMLFLKMTLLVEIIRVLHAGATQARSKDKRSIRFNKHCNTSSTAGSAGRRLV